MLCDNSLSEAVLDPWAVPHLWGIRIPETMQRNVSISFKAIPAAVLVSTTIHTVGPGRTWRGLPCLLSEHGDADRSESQKVGGV
jgi:hypothetical protein